MSVSVSVSVSLMLPSCTVSFCLLGARNRNDRLLLVARRPELPKIHVGIRSP